jgi:hypothetical protein
MIRLVLFLMGLLWPVLVAAAPDAKPVPQLFLIQNSGWMEPFYTDPQSRFRVMVSSLISESAAVGAPVIVATFNRNGQVPGRESPEVIYQGPNDPARVRDAIAAITIPRKPSGAFVDSDFEEALRRGATNLLGSKPGIIWFISNNQNAPSGNDANWLQLSQDFSRLLLEAKQFSRVYAHPVRDEVESAQFGRREGFIFYAIAYGRKAGPALDALVARPGLRDLLGSPAARLRPVDRFATGFRLDAASDALQVDRDWIQITGDGSARRLVLKGSVENRLYPFVIRSARLDLRFRPLPAQPGLEALRVQTDTRALANIPALGRSGPIGIALDIPALPMAGLLDTERRAAGVLTLQLSDIKYEWDRDFLNRLKAVPATGVLSEQAQSQLVASQLPPVFLAPLKVKTSQSDLRLQMIAKRSLWWLWVAVPLLAAALFGLWWRSGQGKKRVSHVVDLNGERKDVRIAKGEKLTLANSRDERFVVTGRGKNPPLVEPVNVEKS